MPHINTVLGKVHADEMGITAVHEQVLMGAPGWQQNPGVWFDMAKVYEKCFNEMMDFRLIGGRCFVDGSGLGGGRDLDLLVKLAQTTGVHVIASTGFWSDYAVTPHFRGRARDGFKSLFCHELRTGMGHTGIKAGIVRAGVAGPAPTPLERTFSEAAIDAAAECGVAVLVDAAMGVEEVLGTASAAGLSAGRIIFAHCDDDMDLDRDIAIAKAGAYVAYDHAGVEDWSKMTYAKPDGRRIEQIFALLTAGHGDRLLISGGSQAFGLGWAEAHVASVGNTLRYFAPKLEEAGIAPEAVAGIFDDNPKRVLPIQ